MATFVYACLFFGALSLISGVIAEESDGSKLTAKAVRAVGFLLLRSRWADFYSD
jgi:hypothetical protein